MKNYHPLKELFWARMRSFYREPDAVFWTYGFPLLLTILLGIAFRNSQQTIIDVDVHAGPRAEPLRDQLLENEEFNVEIHEPEQCADRLRLGKSSIVLVPGDVMEYHFDPTRPDSALARAKLDDALQRSAGRVDVYDTQNVEITEPGARYIDFLVPGLLGMNLLGGGMFGIGFVVTEMRVRNLLRRMVATPMRKSHFLLSLIGGRLVFTIPEMLFIIGAGVIIFKVPIAGGWWAIVILSLVGAVSFSGIGLLVACRARKIETISGLMNLVMLPMWLFSGIFFSSEKFPDAMQPFVRALPLTQLNDALRNVILEGAPLIDQSFPMLYLAAWGLFSFIVALKVFRWT